MIYYVHIKHTELKEPVQCSGCVLFALLSVSCTGFYLSAHSAVIYVLRLILSFCATLTEHVDSVPGFSCTSFQCNTNTLFVCPCSAP